MREKLRKIVSTLNRDIFVGERREKNLRNIAASSMIMMAIGFVMSLVNLVHGQHVMTLTCFLIFCMGLASFISVARFKKRNASIVITSVALVLVLTYDVLFVKNGFAFIWTLLVPLSVCYTLSVKIGMLITAYFQLLFIVAFYTPVRALMASSYSRIVMDRFPLLYFFHGLLVLYVMYQYHNSVLVEIEYTARLNDEVARQTAVAEERSRRIEQMSFQAIQTLAHAIDAKDPYTRGHSTRVSQYSVKIAEALGWDAERVNNLRYAALLHDIGKIGVPDSILNNPGRLSDVEYDIIKSHTTMGGEILLGRITIDIAEDVARCHHERYDGRGYPLGLKGTEIPEEARIVAIADAFDAMSSTRIYRKACEREHIRRELMEGRGKQFDPEYTDIFMDLWDRGLLDDIMREDSPDSDMVTQASSAFLQQAVESFLSQDADAGQIAETIKNEGSYEGALDVEYRHFEKLYEYIANLEKRFSHPFKLIVITLTPNAGVTPSATEQERAMFFMEQSIRQTIRNVDILTRYGRQQFLVILLGTDPEGVRTAVSRIFRGYYKMYGSGAFSPSYAVAERTDEA